jgi:hypothetical protein
MSYEWLWPIGFLIVFYILWKLPNIRLGKKKIANWEPRVTVTSSGFGNVAAELTLRPSPMWRHLLTGERILYVIIGVPAAIVLFGMATEHTSIEDIEKLAWLIPAGYLVAMVAYYFIARWQQTFRMSVMNDGSLVIYRTIKKLGKSYDSTAKSEIEFHISPEDDEKTTRFYFDDSFQNPFHFIQDSDIGTLRAFFSSHGIGKQEEGIDKKDIEKLLDSQG